MADLDKMFAEMADISAEDSAYDFVIDEDLRVIAVPERGVVLGVEGDKDVNRVRFRMNRYYRGTDLSDFSIRINYRPAEGEINYFPVTEKTIQDESICFTWLVGADAVAVKGTVYFIARFFTAEEDGTIAQEFNTTLGNARALEGLAVDVQADDTPVKDLLTQLEYDLKTYVAPFVQQAKTSAENAAQSAVSAKTAETNAAGSATAAASSATAAANSQKAAASSAAAAASSQSAASTSQKAAASSASAAAASQSAAASSADAAATSKSEAASSASSAASSATIATGKASVAAQSADSSAASAQSSASYAGAAETSAQNAKTSADDAKAAQKKAQELADEVGAKVTTDTSLSVSGAPADAKAAGEAIKGTRVTQAGSGRWVLLGSLANTNDSEGLVLDIYTGAGYNADPDQNLWLKVFIKDSFQNTTDTTNANCYGTRVWMFTPNVANSDYSSMQFRIMATQNDITAATSSCEVWMYVPYGYNAGDCIASGSAFSKWTSVMALSTSEPTSGTSQRVEMATVPVGDMTGSSLFANTLNGFDYAAIFPVGCIFQSTSSTSPASFVGGTWEQIASERVLMGASSSHAAGSTVEAGLPDIEGNAELGYTDWNLVMALRKPTGAFSITKKSGAGSYPSCSDDKNSTAGTNTFSFNASDSNAIYGASNTVQPAAYYVYIWHRVA